MGLEFYDFLTIYDLMEKEENFTEKEEISENKKTGENTNTKNAETKISDQTDQKLSEDKSPEEKLIALEDKLARTFAEM